MSHFRPLPTACFERFLLTKGFKKEDKSTGKGDHVCYRKKGLFRPIVLRDKDKEMPALHLKTNCRTLGCSLNELYKWAEINC